MARPHLGFRAPRLTSKFFIHILIINSRFGSKLLAARLSQELRQREAANTSWRSPVWASAPCMPVCIKFMYGFRRGSYPLIR